MRKVFVFDSPSQPYVADAIVLCCFDHRIRLATDKFLQRQRIRMPDVIAVAGGTKMLASPRSDFDRKFVLDQMRLSTELHQAKRIIVTSHSDCGAYGGLASFHHDVRIEAEHHARELQTAVTLLEKIFPAVSVEAYFVDFEGVWELPAGATQRG